jgi:sulfopyruvate decarboxylase subunit beta
MDLVGDELVVSNLGDSSKELYHTRDRPENFYMLGSMGLTSSISLGLALGQDRKVVCLDGDGSILMNLGSLATIANSKPPNLVLVVLDNEAYGTTGNQRSFTAGTTDLHQMAEAAGIQRTSKVENTEELKSAMEDGLKNNGLSYVHVLVQADEEKNEWIPYDPITIKNRFMKELSS